MTNKANTHTSQKKQYKRTSRREGPRAMYEMIITVVEATYELLAEYGERHHLPHDEDLQVRIRHAGGRS
jgi:hypothetical protein